MPRVTHEQPEGPATLPPLDLPAVLTASDAWRRSLLGETDEAQRDADPALIAAARAQSQAAEAFAALNAIRQNRNPANTPAQHLKRIADAGKKATESVFSAADRARSSLAESAAKLNKSIEARIMKLSDDAPEIRQALRAMPESARQQAVEAAIRDGDLEVLGAVFSGRSVTTGIDSKHLAAFRAMAERQLAPDLLEQRAKHAKAQRLVTDVIDTTIRIGEGVAGSRELQAKYEREARAADEAALRLEQAAQV